jgi:hypothetical protein
LRPWKVRTAICLAPYRSFGPSRHFNPADLGDYTRQR